MIVNKQKNKNTFHLLSYLTQSQQWRRKLISQPYLCCSYLLLSTPFPGVPLKSLERAITVLRVTDLITSLIYSLLSPSLFTTTDLDMTHSFLLRSYPLSPLRSFKPPVSDPSPTPPLSRRYFPPLTTNLLPPKNPFISTVSTFSLVCSMPSHGYGVVQHLINSLLNKLDKDINFLCHESQRMVLVALPQATSR
ncbi:hypothetical protein YC2023_037361 [Brassica napus]